MKTLTKKDFDRLPDSGNGLHPGYSRLCRFR